jgi:polyisoprenoid-binding protein YceI
MKHYPSRASRYFPAAFARASQASVVALALALSACQADEKKTQTQPAPLTPSASPSTPPTAPSAATPNAAQPGALTTLTLDPASSRLQIVAAKITRSHDGSFKQFTGSASLAGEQVQSVSFEVDTASLETDTEKLTEHIKTKDFLDVEKFPKASFKSSSIVAKPAGTATHEITGELTMHGVTAPISFPATIDITPDSVTGRAEIRVNRQKFGIVYPGMPDDLIKDEVVLKPLFVFLRKKA